MYIVRLLHSYFILIYFCFVGCSKSPELADTASWGWSESELLNGIKTYRAFSSAEGLFGVKIYTDIEQAVKTPESMELNLIKSKSEIVLKEFINNTNIQQITGAYEASKLKFQIDFHGCSSNYLNNVKWSDISYNTKDLNLNKAVKHVESSLPSEFLKRTNFSVLYLSFDSAHEYGVNYLLLLLYPKQK